MQRGAVAGGRHLLLPCWGGSQLGCLCCPGSGARTAPPAKILLVTSVPWTCGSDLVLGTQLSELLTSSCLYTSPGPWKPGAPGYPTPLFQQPRERTGVFGPACSEISVALYIPRFSSLVQTVGLFLTQKQVVPSSPSCRCQGIFRLAGGRTSQGRAVGFQEPCLFSHVSPHACGLLWRGQMRSVQPSQMKTIRHSARCPSCNLIVECRY